jgi:DDE superfamily endonuclease/Psq-like protein
MNLQEDQIQAAIEALSAGAVTSVRAASKMFHVPRSTLQGRIEGRLSAKARQQSRQRLTVQEEDSIVRAIYKLSQWGWPMSIHWLESFVTNLLQKKGDMEPLGHNWYLRFLERHPNLRTKWSRCMDQQRHDAEEYNSIDKWFKLFDETVKKYGICDEDIYNMDEKGFMKGIGDNAKVIIPRSEAAISCQPGNREWVSVIEAIGTNDYLVPPFVIFRGKRIQQSWINVLSDHRMVIAVSENGWTNHELGVQWIQHFDRYTKGQVRGKYRLLTFDGHSSHATLDFVQFCEDHYIVPLCLPPHSTHFLQPLDVAFFGPLAHAYKKIVREKSLFGAQRVSNEDFLIFFQEARMSVKHNIPSAWKTAGLKPFDPNLILQQLRPKTPPKVTFTNENGVSFDIAATHEGLATKINDIVAGLEASLGTPVRPQLTLLQQTCLTVVAEWNATQLLNESLVTKAKEERKKKSSKKGAGNARILSVEEIRNNQTEKDAKIADETVKQQRVKALYGKGKFAKLVWKELHMEIDIFE